MEKIDGLIIPNLTFLPKKLGDLLYYDGPLLSHFIDEERPEDNYLYRWIDNNEDENRWLISKVSVKDLTDFFEQKLSLRKLIENAQFVILLDLDDDLDKKKIILTTITNLPNSYLPSASSTFKAKFYHEYALQLKDTLIQNRENEKIKEEALKRVSELEEERKLLLIMLGELLEREKPEKELIKPNKSNLSEKMNSSWTDTVSNIFGNNYNTTNLILN